MKKIFNTVKVSVIVPIYNCEEYITRCLDSLIFQSYKNVEILLINDGSTDNSLEKCKEYQLKDDRVLIINQRNCGPSSARNKGIVNSTGEYIVFCDSDDYLDQNAIEKLVRNHKKNCLVGIMHKIINKDSEDICFYKKSYTSEEYIYNVLTDKTLGNIWGYLFETEKAKKVLFDTNTNCMEDMLFFLTYIKRFDVKKIEFIQNSYYNYVNNMNSITTAKSSDKNENVKKCTNYFYSLEKIDKLTKKIYSKEINDKKIKILENYLISSKWNKKTFILFSNQFTIRRYSKKSVRFLLFSKIYIGKRYALLSIYYFLIHLIKRIRRIVYESN